jgi:hypothetical protein
MRVASLLFTIAAACQGGGAPAGAGDAGVTLWVDTSSGDALRDLVATCRDAGAGAGVTLYVDTCTAARRRR